MKAFLSHASLDKEFLAPQGKLWVKLHNITTETLGHGERQKKTLGQDAQDKQDKKSLFTAEQGKPPSIWSAAARRRFSYKTFG